MVRSIIVFIIVISIVSCKSFKDVSNSNLPFELSEKEQFNFQYNFSEANKLFLLGDFEKARNYYLECLKIDSTSAVCYYKLASVYLYDKDFKIAQDYALKAVRLNNGNIWYKYLLGNLYTHNKNYEKAILTFKGLIKLEPKELDFYLNLADIQLKSNDLKGSLKTLTDIQDNFGISEMISLEKHKIYLHQKKFKEALNELELLANKFNSNLKYKRLIAEFYFSRGDINEAIAIYNNNLENNKFDGYSRLGLAECYFSLNNTKKAIEELKLGFKSKEVESDIKISLLVNLMQKAKNEKSFETTLYELTEILIKLYPNNPDINTIYADFLLRNNLLKEARLHLRKVIDVRKDKYMIWEQLLLLENEFNDWTALFNESTEALMYFPNQSFIYFFNGFSAFQLNKFTEAKKSFEFGFKLITKDDPLRKDYLTFLGETYYKLGDKSKAYSTFKSLLEEDNDNIMVLNNYAYYLSIDNENLDDAALMSKKTIEKEPNNPTYLDTYAWILFKQKRYSEALKYIKKAIELDINPSDVVLEHYGDILFHNGSIDEAIIYWQKALEKGNGSGVLKEKISNKEYVK